MKQQHLDFGALVRAIKTSISVTEYANNVLGMNCIEYERCAATYRGGTNPTSFISYGDSYTDFGYPGGKRQYCDVIQLCADARHNGSRSDAIYELARSHITQERLSVILQDSVSWDQHIKTLENKINYWHSKLRPEDREYLHSRRITDATIERLKIGYCAPMKRLITPYQHNGHFVYYSGRDVTGEWKVNNERGKYTKMAIHHFYVENIPFGLHTLEPEHRALFPKTYTASDGRSYPFADILCVLEGQVDALSFEQEGFQVCSPIGGYFNEMQMPYFLSIARKIGKVFVCFDNDGAGTGFQLKMAQQLFQHRIPFVSSVVPKKINGMIPKASGQIALQQDSNNVIGLNTNWKTAKVNSGDVLTLNDGTLFLIDEVISETQLTLKSNFTGQSGIFGYEITQYIKDVSDYYTAGGNLADLVANADDGLVTIGRIIGNDYKKLKDFIKKGARTNERSDLIALLNACTQIDPKIKSALLKEATRIPTQDDLVNELVGYTDENGKKHKGLYMLKYVENDSFYEYKHGVWIRTSDIIIKKYISEALGKFRRSDIINGTFNLLMTVCAVRLPNPELANYFNTNSVFNLANGILDLSAPDEEIKTLRPHKPEYLSSHQVSYMYKSDAKCPKILAFLKDVLWYKNERITQQKIMLAQEYFAYPLFSTNPIHKMMFLLGDGRNGKGTVLELLRALYGDGCASYVNPARFNENFERIYLLNSMVNICFDAERDFRASQEIIKQVVAGESIMACYKFQNQIHFQPRAKLITACNNLVKVADVSRGFLSRCLFLNFNQCYEGRENFNLANELKEELPGFLNWILEGYIRLRKKIAEGKGFTVTDEQKESMKLFEEHTSPVFAFYEDKISEFKANGYVDTGTMHKKYLEWALANKYPEKNRGSFTREFKTILKQKHPEMFELYGLSMTRHGILDEYDFTCIKLDAPISQSDVEREKNKLEVPAEINDTSVISNENEQQSYNNIPPNSEVEREKNKLEVPTEINDTSVISNENEQQSYNNIPPNSEVEREKNKLEVPAEINDTSVISQVDEQQSYNNIPPNSEVEREKNKLEVPTESAAKPVSSEVAEHENDEASSQEKMKAEILGSVIGEGNMPAVFIPANYEPMIFRIAAENELERDDKVILAGEKITPEECLIVRDYLRKLLELDYDSMYDQNEKREFNFWQVQIKAYGSLDNALHAQIKRENERRRLRTQKSQAQPSESSEQSKPRMSHVIDECIQELDQAAAEYDAKMKAIEHKYHGVNQQAQVQSAKPENAQIVTRELAEQRVNKVKELLSTPNKELFEQRAAFEYWSELFRKYKARHPMSDISVLWQIVNMHWDKCPFKNNSWPKRENIPPLCDEEF